jgi:putative ABC transport system substrate-binding protein
VKRFIAGDPQPAYTDGIMGLALPSFSRRRFLRSGIALAGLGSLPGCGGRLVPGPQPAKVPRVGGLLPQAASFPRVIQFRAAFLAGLAELGYEDGRTIAVELRYADGKLERLPELAAELAHLPVDVLVVHGDPAMAAAKQATGTVPIVFALSSAPVESGYVASLGRPGGNITGLSEMTPELSGKRLELLRGVAPSLARVAVVWSPQFPGPALQYRELEGAAGATGVEVLPLPVRGPEDIGPAFEVLGRGGADAVVVLTGSVTSPSASQIVELVARSRLPAIYGERLWADAGGLMSYGADVADMWRRAAGYVDKILKGISPAELPVEQPTTFDFVINLRTAHDLGLTIPPSVLQQATEVIE